MENTVTIEGFLNTIFYSEDGSRANGRLWYGKQYNSDADKMVEFIGFGGKISAGFKPKDRVVITGFLNQRTYKEDTITQIVVNEMRKSEATGKAKTTPKAPVKQKAKPSPQPTKASEDIPF